MCLVSRPSTNIRCANMYTPTLKGRLKNTVTMNHFLSRELAPFFDKSPCEDPKKYIFFTTEIARLLTNRNKKFRHLQEAKIPGDGSLILRGRPQSLGFQWTISIPGEFNGQSQSLGNSMGNLNPWGNSIGNLNPWGNSIGNLIHLG